MQTSPDSVPSDSSHVGDVVHSSTSRVAMKPLLCTNALAVVCER